MQRKIVSPGFVLSKVKSKICNRKPGNCWMLDVRGSMFGVRCSRLPPTSNVQPPTSLPFSFENDAQRVDHDLKVQGKRNIFDIQQVKFASFNDLVDIFGISKLYHAPAC